MSRLIPRLTIPLTQLRSRLTEALEATVQRENRVIITRHGKQIAALVTMDELDLIWRDEDYTLYGPINPATGHRHGAAWVKATGWKRPLAEAEATTQDPDLQDLMRRYGMQTEEDDTPAKPPVDFEQMEADFHARCAAVDARQEERKKAQEGSEGSLESVEGEESVASDEAVKRRWGWFGRRGASGN